MVSLITALFELVGSRHILNLTCPWLSLFSTRTKLLIHSAASFTGSRTLACIIWLISFWNASLRGLVWVCMVFVLAWPWDQPGYDTVVPWISLCLQKCLGIPVKSVLMGYKCRWLWFVALDVVSLIICFHYHFMFLNLDLCFCFSWDGLPLTGY